MNDDLSLLFLRAIARYLGRVIACTFRITLLCIALSAVLLGLNGLLYHSASISALERLVSLDTLWDFLAETPYIGKLIGDITGLYKSSVSQELLTTHIVRETTCMAVLSLITPLFQKIDLLIASLSERIISGSAIAKAVSNIFSSIMVVLFAVCCTTLIATPLCSLTAHLPYRAAIIIIPLCVFLILLLVNLIGSHGSFRLSTVCSATLDFVKDALCACISCALVTAMHILNACETPGEEGLAIAIIVISCLFLSCLLPARLKTLIVHT